MTKKRDKTRRRKKRNPAPTMANFNKVLTLLNEDVDWEKLAETYKPESIDQADYITHLKLYFAQTAFNLTDDELLFLAEDRAAFRKLMGFPVDPDAPVTLPQIVDIEAFNQTMEASTNKDEITLALARQLQSRGKMIKTPFLFTAFLLPDYKPSHKRDEEWDVDLDYELDEEDFEGIYGDEDDEDDETEVDTERPTN